MRYRSWINSPLVFLASSSVCLHLSLRLPPPFEVQPSHYGSDLHPYTHRQIWQPSYIGVFPSFCVLHVAFFNFLLLQLIVEEWLFEIVPFNLRRWSLLKHCVYLLTTGGHCSLRVFVSVHCFSHIPMGSERWEVCGWSILDIDLIHESLSLFYHPSIHVSNR